VAATETELVVVGAGLAGLTAAREIAAAGFVAGAVRSGEDAGREVLGAA